MNRKEHLKEAERLEREAERNEASIWEMLRAEERKPGGLDRLSPLHWYVAHLISMQSKRAVEAHHREAAARLTPPRRLGRRTRTENGKR